MSEYGAPPPDPAKGSTPEPGQAGAGQSGAEHPDSGQPPYGQPPSYVKQPPPPYGQQPPPYGQQPPPYGQQPPPYGQQPPPYGEPGGYGQPTPYGQPPPYGQQPPPYGQPAGYGQPPYGQPAYGGPGYPGASSIPAGVQFASMPRRLGARLLDSLILTVFAIAFGAAIFGGFGAGGQLNFDTDPVTNEFVDGTGLFLAFYGWLGLMWLTSTVYEVVLTAVRGGTWGKQILGVKVLRAEDGQIPGWGPAVLRWLIPFVGYWFCGIGQIAVYLSPFFDSSGRNQGWHDSAAKTVVIRT